MRNKNWKSYLFWISLAEIVGIIAGLLSQNGMKDFQIQITQPPLSPPPLLFPIVWSILYALMGISAARISLSQPSQARSLGLNLFVVQLAVNFLWPFFFFNLQAYGFAILWLILLWLLVAAMIYVFQKADTAAAILQIPYLLWLSFALYLNIGVWLLNM